MRKAEREPAGAPRAPGPRARSEPRHHPGNQLNDLTGREWIKFTKTWFVCDSPRYHRNRNSELHPARFPEELAAEFIRFFTQQRGWVLDPFCGSGATLVAAREEGRNAVGIELSPRYAQTTRRRLAASQGETEAVALQGDARHVASLLTRDSRLASRDSFDLILTSPPYWDMLRHPRGGVKSKHQQRIAEGLDGAYSEDPQDLGNLTDYEEFIEALGGIFDGLAPLLRPGKYLVVVAQNLRVPGGEVKPLAWDLTRRLSQTYSFQGERIWCQNSKPLGIWGYPKVFVPNYHHHYCLVFRKSP
jgi:DNA modification methylase